MTNGQAVYQEFERKTRAFERLSATKQITYSEAFNTAVTTALMGEDGLVDYSKLEDAETGRRFAELMGGVLINDAKKIFGAQGTQWDEITAEQALLGIYGTGVTSLTGMVHDRRAGFDYNFFNNAINGDNGLLKRVMSPLFPTTYNHVSEADFVPVLNHLGVEHPPENLTLDKLVSAMQSYRTNGVVIPAILNN